MNEYELLRVIDFLERTRRPYQQHVASAEPDATWNILVMLIRRSISGQLVTLSSLAKSADVPHATAMRRIHKLIEEGWITQTPRSLSGKTSARLPSERLLEQFKAHARDVKALLAHTFGWRASGESEDDYFFGGTLSLEPMLPPRHLLEKRLHDGMALRFMLRDDNYFASMRDVWSDFRSNLASRRDFELVGPLPNLYDRLLANATAPQSTFDVVTLNFPWIGEFASRNLVRPLDDLIEAGAIDPSRKRSPASVSVSRRVLRWNSRTPRFASSRATLRLTAAGVRPPLDSALANVRSISIAAVWTRCD